jgi:sec-independent protein translocase protein TatA
MPFINPGHFWLILLLLVVVLIIWGPGKLPDVGAGMGRAIREFKKATNEVKDSVVNASSTHSEPHGESHLACRHQHGAEARGQRGAQDPGLTGSVLGARPVHPGSPGRHRPRCLIRGCGVPHAPHGGENRQCGAS